MWSPTWSFLLLLTSLTAFINVHARFIVPAVRHVAHNLVYANGNSEGDLPICSTDAVCNRMENYFGSPRIHRLCRCPNIKTKVADLHFSPEPTPSSACSTTMDVEDGHTITDDSQMYKVCGSVSVFPTCRFFHDTAYTITTYPAQNRTQQVIRCVCPTDSTTYILKWKQKHQAPNHKMTYHYACSPQTFLKCGEDEPCSLFVDSGSSVSKQAVCSCAHGWTCANRVTEASVKLLTVDANLGATTYAAYCRQESSSLSSTLAARSQ